MSKRGTLEICALIDPDVAKGSEVARSLNPAPAVYGPSRYAEMLEQCDPYVVLIVGPDSTHVGYAVEALLRDINVVVEKPLATSASECRAIAKAEARSGGRVTVTMNLRFDPVHRLIRRLIVEGRLGRVTNVEFAYNVDLTHGASYFRRWHRHRELSGGLSVTKSCHHFDLMNWWLDDYPEQVFAYGALNFFGAVAGESDPNRRDSSASEAPIFNLEARPASIEDTYSGVIRFRGGASATYSICFSSAWEGLTLGLNGTLGRIETVQYIAPRRCSFPVSDVQIVRYIPLRGRTEVFEVGIDEEHHRTADRAMLEELCEGPSAESMSVGAIADSRAGIYAVAAGEAMWRSVDKNCPVDIEDLLAPSPAPAHESV
jgi:predicted dehydrogenase